MDNGNAGSDVDRVIITGDLDRRPSRAPDYEAEARALTALAEAMSTSPGTVLQRLVEVAMALTRSNSVGISLLEPGGENGIFRWVATAGVWSPYRDGTIPLEASPCGEVIAREVVLLMKNPERSFPALLQAEPGIGEVLLAPFHVGGVPVGTVWTIKHSPDDHFEAEDARILGSLARFASAAHQTVQALQLAEAAGQQAELRYRQLVTLADVSTEFFGTCDMELMPIYGNAAAMRMVGLADEEQVKRTPLQEFFFPEDQAFIINDFIPRVLREGQAKVEIRFRHFATGEPVWVDYSVVVLRDETGQATGLGTVTHDLTERKRAESVRAKADQSFTRLFQASPAPFLILKPDAPRFTIREVNDAYLSATMTTREGVVGRGAFEAFPDNPDDPTIEGVSTLRASLERVLATREPDTLPNLKYDVARPDGTFEERWWSPVNSAVLGDDGEVEALIHNANDVTEAHRVQVALRESEERQAFLLKLSDKLRPLGDAMEVQTVALGVLGEHLGANRAFFNEIDEERDAYVVHRTYVNGVAPLTGQFRLSDIRRTAELAGSGQIFVIEDARADPRLSAAERASYAAMEVAAGVAVPLIKDGRWVAGLGVHHATPRHWSPEDIDLIRETAERTWAAVELARAEAALRDSEERFRQFSDASTNVLWIRDAGTLRMEFASPAFDRIYGIPGPELGGNNSLRGWARLIEPENRKSVLANFRRVRAGERVDHEFQIKRATDGALRWIHNTDFPLRDAAGNVRWVAGLGADITGARETSDRQGVLVGELQHRTRNLIAVVRSLSDRTLGNAVSLDDFGTRFRLRLSALSRVQGLLSHVAIGEKIMFDELLRSELDVHGASNDMAHKITLEGPDDVPLRSATVQTLALALHELATNAAKYGALEASNGHLFVGWRVEPSTGSDLPRLHVEWRETGVSTPEVGAPARGGGYGRELIERALPYQLKARTTYEIGPDGVRCTIDVPIAGGGGVNGKVSMQQSGRRDSPTMSRNTD